MTVLKDWLTTTEAAEIIGRSRPQITRYCQRGLLRYIEVGNAILIRAEDARKFTPPPRGNPDFLLQSQAATNSSPVTV